MLTIMLTLDKGEKTVARRTAVSDATGIPMIALVDEAMTLLTQQRRKDTTNA
jgi:hypothetical protein